MIWFNSESQDHTEREKIKYERQVKLRLLFCILCFVFQLPNPARRASYYLAR
nr:MAG TPA: hypothetical protein [Bacteriophage sp.]